MWTVLGLSPRAIAAQAGWKLDNANRMLAVYGHGEVGALQEVDASFYRPMDSQAARWPHDSTRGSREVRQQARCFGGE